MPELFAIVKGSDEKIFRPSSTNPFPTSSDPATASSASLRPVTHHGREYSEAADGFGPFLSYNANATRSMLHLPRLMKRPNTLPTRAARFLRWTRRTLAGTAVLALLLGMLACADEIRRNINAPAQALSTWPGAAFSLSGTITDIPKDAEVSIVVHTSPENNLLAINSATSSPRWFVEGQRWRVTLTALPQLGTGELSIGMTARITDAEGSHERELAPWRITVLPDAQSAQRTSFSILERHFGTDPLLAAFFLLGLGLLTGFLTPVAGRLLSRNLARYGYLLVYHTKTDGDDTLLYCVDTSGHLLERTGYPVFSAVGQMLGVAALTIRGRRHCVLRLPAAQARAGCFIALRPT